MIGLLRFKDEERQKVADTLRAAALRMENNDVAGCGELLLQVAGIFFNKARSAGKLLGIDPAKLVRNSLLPHVESLAEKLRS